MASIKDIEKEIEFRRANAKVLSSLEGQAAMILHQVMEAAIAELIANNERARNQIATRAVAGPPYRKTWGATNEHVYILITSKSNPHSSETRIVASCVISLKVSGISIDLPVELEHLDPPPHTGDSAHWRVTADNAVHEFRSPKPAAIDFSLAADKITGALYERASASALDG